MSTCIPVGLVSSIDYFAFSVSLNEAILKNDKVQLFLGPWLHSVAMETKSL